MKNLFKIRIFIAVVTLAFFAISCSNSDKPMADNTITGVAKANTNLSILVQALVKTNYEDVADSILNMLKQRISGDYLQTSAILDDKFNVNSAVNNANDYQGPGTGYRVQGERWEEIKNIPNIINPDDI